jgi:hypothetical protein
MVGIPYVIETNYVGIETTVILPITGEISHPDNVRVYINHSDGTVEILDGTVVYTNGEPSGIKITINHFSTFQVMELPADDDNSDVEETDDNTGVDSSKDTNDEKSHDQNEEEETEDLVQPADTDVSAADTQQDSGNEKMTEPIGQDAADVVWEEDLIEKDGKYYVLVDTVIGKSLVLVCGAQDMPSGTQSEIKAAIMERFGKDIKMPDGDFTLADLAALILQELSEAHTIVSR